MNNDLTWYKLLNVKGIGPKSMLLIYRAIRTYNITIQDIFNLTQHEFKSIFGSMMGNSRIRFSYEDLKNINLNKVEKSYHDLLEKNVRLVTLEHPLYPKNIKNRLKTDSPPILYVIGNDDLLSVPNVSIVGSRNTEYPALEYTKELSGKLTESGFNIVSGYAKGVDTYAHVGALERKGTTSVVLSLGINNLTIKNDFKIGDRLKHCLFISQFLPNDKWSGKNAMTRNKIVVSLSKALIVICSGSERDSNGRMSGTYDAAINAIKLGIPTYILSPGFFTKVPLGNVELIKKGGIEFANYEELIKKLQLDQYSTLSENSQLSLFGSTIPK